MLTISNTTEGYLKNVEIKGNTVQNPTNLVDIKSVGKKLENQDLYEIPLLSVGKNLIDANISIKDNTIINSLGVEVSDSGNALTDFNPINPGNVIYSNKIKRIGVKAVLYNRRRDYVKSVFLDALTVIEENIAYIRFQINKTQITVNDFLNYGQLEYGIQATSFEKHQSNKITILSPVQLEKGDVIKEVNGVWGVEKNNSKIYFDIDNVNKLVAGVHTNNTFVYKLPLDNILSESSNKYSFSNIVPQGVENDWQQDKEQTYTSSTGVHVQILKSKLSSQDFNGVKKFLIDSNAYIIYRTKTPQFIPLPHDQQILLKTFDNKTNISFLTEIEGTIKAQVPKSMKATVSTHTSQIENIYDELDRVKKLEESTVSTVITDKDFANVQATSQGYFEDVKLSGKTLVNKLTNVVSAGVSNNTIRRFDCGEALNGNTIIFDSKGGAYECSIYDSNTAVDAYSSNNFTSFKKLSYLKIYVKKKDATVITDIEAKSCLMVLEGDYTQNPPSYFEGLKSVGDGTDEIVVSSVDGDGNLFDDSPYKGIEMKNGVSGEYAIIPIKLSSGLISFKLYDKSLNRIKSDKIAIRFKDKDKKTLNFISCANESDVIYDLGNATKNINYKDVAYIQLFNNNLVSDCVIGGLSITNNSTPIVDYIQHKADKKRILYYDPTDNTWKKPTLREWDTIEKHSDGKYYYHQRSLEENYISGDESKADCITDMTKTVKKLAQEKVFECTNIDLITYANETNYVFNGGVISPRTSLKVHSNISNVVSLLQKKVSVIEERFLNHVITQNRLQLASTYSTDSVTFKVDYASKSISPLDNDLYNLIKKNILVGKENYDYETMCTMLLDYASWSQITWDQYDELMTIVDEQQNPTEELPEEAPVL